MSKRQRTEDENIQSSNIGELFDQMPLLNRSFQMIHFIKNNPPIINHSFSKIELLQYIFNYLMENFKRFFHQTGLYYVEEHNTLRESNLAFYIFYPTSPYEFRLNFDTLITYIRGTFFQIFKDTNLKIDAILIQEDAMWFEFSFNPEGSIKIVSDFEFRSCTRDKIGIDF